jgi:8-oxo-dGTP pyrophosphatase MutT (NUDIX family)
MPHRNWLLEKLRAHQPFNQDEKIDVETIMAFIERNSDCFDRTNPTGHITGSAWVVNPLRNRVLLLHHAKLDRWLQPGGHSDGDFNTLAVAQRELHEESGLPLEICLPANEDIFDVDIHAYPRKGSEPPHIHYDVRFLFEIDDGVPLQKNEESQALGWFTVDEAVALENKGLNTRRMLEKTQEMAKLTAA